MSGKAFRSLAWGYHEPGGAVLWWIVQPTRHLHILSELCFEQLDESELVVQVHRRDRALRLKKISYTVGTPAIVQSCEQSRGFRGEMIGDRLGFYGMIIIAADDDRLNGWKRCHSLLRAGPDGEPWLTIDPSCEQLIRAIPAGLRDQADADDVRVAHPTVTAFRYGAMSAPSPESVSTSVHYPEGTPGFYLKREQAQQRHR